MVYFNFHHHNLQEDSGIYNLTIEETAPEALFSAGIHPENVTENLDKQMEWLTQVAALKNCVAVGECGLDARFTGNFELQLKFFKEQILLANELNKPLIIHCVNHFQEIIQLRKLSKVPMIIHGFNKRKTIGAELLRHGFHLSFGKSILSNVNLQEFFIQVPLNRILLETDAASTSIKEIYQKTAALHNLEIEKFALEIEKNLHELNIPSNGQKLA